MFVGVDLWLIRENSEFCVGVWVRDFEVILRVFATGTRRFNMGLDATYSLIYFISLRSEFKCALDFSHMFSVKFENYP
jgi:hypothetical protein